MQLFSAIKPTDYTIVIGCGRLGAHLANTISDHGGNVLILDKNKEAFRKLAPSFGGLAVTGDGTDFDVLHEARMDKASVVVVVTNNDNANVMIAQIAREVFRVERVVTRLYDPERECVYHESGIDTVCPSVLSADEIDRILTGASAAKKTGEVPSSADKEAEK